MGGEDCDSSDDDDTGSDRDLPLSVEVQIERLRTAFLSAVAAGDDARARQLVKDFEESLDWLSDVVRQEVVSETTVELGELARRLRDDEATR